MPENNPTQGLLFNEGEKHCKRCFGTKPIADFIGSKGRETVFCHTCRTVPLKDRITPDSLRKCPRCQQVKKISEFMGQRRKNRSGNFYWVYCRICNTDVQRERIRKKIKTGEATQEYKKAYKKKRWANLLKQYGLSREKYESMEKAQNGLCAICGEPETKMYKDVLKRLVVDHDHKTGKVRGLLCCSCNIGIGNLDDDIEKLRKAIHYLELHR